jgi:hypothetical protein
MTITFKKFNECMSSTELSEEQLSELFGIFSNNKKIDQMKALRKELQDKAAAKQKQDKDSAWNSAAKAARDEELSKYQKKPAGMTPSRGAGRAADFEYGSK